MSSSDVNQVEFPWWRKALTLLGFPIIHGEVKWLDLRVYHVVVVSLLCLISIPTLGDRGAIERFGFVAADPMRDFGITFLTPFFLHAGWFHLLGNLYFLILFGNRATLLLSPARYLTLIIGALVFGNLLHAVFATDPTIPCIGASDAISGIIAFYCLAVPQQKMTIFLIFRFITIPAWVFFFFWLGIQVLGFSEQSAGLTDTSYAAHLGGMLTGLFTWISWKSSGQVHV
ncbi:MAG: rhomboid family intramembrane serine protease [Leptospirales bacterium]|nr:rhomboid family intramembrane serine protease [Leptospirales bacterium]